MADELTSEDRRLLAEVKVKLENVHDKLNELKQVLFGEKMDGFLYRFAGMEPDIKGIPAIKQRLDDVVSEAEDLQEKLKPMIDKVNNHEEVMKTQRLIRTLIVVAISTITSIIISILTIWSMVKPLLDKGSHP